jgi:hypothetical protein
MWKQVSVSLNGHEVEKIDNYPYRAYLSMLTSYSKDVLEKRGELSGWARDTHTAWCDTVYATTGKNEGFKTRGTPFRASKEVVLIGRIDSDVMNQGRDIPPNTDIQVCLTRSSDAFALMSATDGASYKLLVLDAELVVARDKLAPSLHHAHVELTQKYNLSMDYRHSKVLTYNLALGTTTGSITNAFSSNTNLPDRFVAFVVTNEAFSGALKINPFEFGHHKLNCIVAKVNENTLVPSDGYKPNFTSGRVENVYYNLLREFDADEENFMLDLSKLDFCNGYTIYPFRIVPRTRGGDVLGPAASGSISIEYSFAEALTVTCTLVLVADYRGSFEIRSHGDFAPL